MRLLATLLCLTALVSGCGRKMPVQSSPTLKVLVNANLPSPERGDLVAPDRVSLIGPFDSLTIDVFNVPDLTREVQVDASGRVSLPLAGAIDATGKTSEELAEAIAQRLRRYVRDPQVTVNLRGSVSQVVTVDGEVKEPGLYPVNSQMTLMRAIASAKGLSDVASLDDVVILRSVNGQRVAGLYNLTAVRRGQYPDPLVFANDVVLVGDSPTRRLFKDLISVAPLLTAPIIAVLQNR